MTDLGRNSAISAVASVKLKESDYLKLKKQIYLKIIDIRATLQNLLIY